MIITSRVLGMQPGSVRIPERHQVPTQEIAELHFAPHMYGNPYQELLYAKFAETGISVRGHRSIAGAVKAITNSKAKTKVLHLHWLNVILADSAESEFETRIAEFAAQLKAVKAVGGKIVWTVHNVLPHEGYQVEPSIRIRKLIVEAADMIHVMSPETVERCAKYFDIPTSKVVQLEHAGYHGFYPEVSTGTDLKAMWGIPRSAKVLVSLGGIKPYKGLGAFAEVFAKSADPNLHFLIAGKSDADFQQSELWRLAELSPNLHVFPELVADSQVSSLMQLADAVVIPYQASLNSGALVLALTFAKPVLARSSAGSVHLLANGAGKIYRDESDLPSYLENLDWLDSAKVAAESMSKALDHTELAIKTAAVFAEFIRNGTDAAAKIANQHSGSQND
ncbi:MAG: hypothetical protein RL038_156 [Actinomycetota bacterium]|jgi:glycosyltransferase involved in cell wall biosynthesis